MGDCMIKLNKNMSLVEYIKWSQEQDTESFVKNELKNIMSNTAYQSILKDMKLYNIIDLFTCGYCYWYAYLLQIKYHGEIWYLPVDNHFIYKQNNKYYDITGDITNYVNNLPDNQKAVSWEHYKKLDYLHTDNLYKYCINKECDVYE